MITEHPNQQNFSWLKPSEAFEEQIVKSRTKNPRTKSVIHLYIKYQKAQAWILPDDCKCSRATCQTKWFQHSQHIILNLEIHRRTPDACASGGPAGKRKKSVPVLTLSITNSSNTDGCVKAQRLKKSHYSDGATLKLIPLTAYFGSSCDMKSAVTFSSGNPHGLRSCGKTTQCCAAVLFAERNPTTSLGPNVTLAQDLRHKPKFTFLLKNMI